MKRTLLQQCRTHYYEVVKEIVNSMCGTNALEVTKEVGDVAKLDPGLNAEDWVTNSPKMTNTMCKVKASLSDASVNVELQAISGRVELHCEDFTDGILDPTDLEVVYQTHSNWRRRCDAGILNVMKKSIVEGGYLTGITERGRHVAGILTSVLEASILVANATSEDQLAAQEFQEVYAMLRAWKDRHFPRYRCGMKS